MPLEDDLDVYLDDEGEQAVLDGVAVRVLYGAPGSTALLGQGVGMSFDKPRALLAAASIPPRGASDPVLEFVEVRPSRAQRFLVRETVLDGTGMASLILATHPDQS